MSKALSLGSVVCLVVIVSWGCRGESSTPDGGGPAGPSAEADRDDSGGQRDDGQESTEAVSVVYCGKCGQTKGTDACCASDAMVCAKCTLHQGSALCCKVPPEMAGKDICSKCGYVCKEDGSCCQGGADRCPDCGRHNDSPLCCKIDSA
jgi:hypothetical protein